MNRGKWNSRAFTSLNTLSGFLIVSVTGLVLYVVPQGRVADWTHWRFLGLSKAAWGDVHVLSSILFAIAGGFHIYFNWRALLGYLRDKATATIRAKRELAIAGGIAVLVVASGVAKLPPLSYLLDLSEAIKAAWAPAKELDAPFGHAEELSLAAFCKKTGIPVDPAVRALREAGLKEVTGQESLQSIARANDTSPMGVYRHIRHLAAPEPARPAGTAWTAESVEERFASSGIGGRSLADMAAASGTDVQATIDRLARAGIEAEPDQTLKAIGQPHGLRPLEVLKAALVEGYQPAKAE